MEGVTPRENNSFSLKKRARSFTHAVRGMGILLSSTHNAWVEVAVLIATIILGFYFNISVTEWISIVLASAAVLSAEAFNTAIEIHMDLTSPDHHPYARDTKDVAAGAVLIAAIGAVIVGISIFGPHLMKLICF